MAQTTKVQDGKVVYSSSSPSTLNLTFDVKGIANVTKEVNVGDDILANGTISTPPTSGTDLILKTYTNGTLKGNLRFEPVGRIVLNNVAWPDGTITPTPGMFIGVSAVNNLQFYPFIRGTTPSDSLTDGQLTTQFPETLAGQYVLGPTVLYINVGAGAWRKFAETTSVTDTQLFVSKSVVNYSSESVIPILFLPVDSTVLSIQVIIDEEFNGNPTMSIGVVEDNSKYSAIRYINALDPETDASIVYPGQEPNTADEQVNIYFSSGGSTTGKSRVIISYAYRL